MKAQPKKKYTFYKPRYARYEPKNVFVYLGIENGEAGSYCPIGQHSAIDLGYLQECVIISKAQYIKASMGLYTPEEYLQ